MAPDASLDRVLARTCGHDPDGRPTIRCEDARALAARFAVPMADIGRLCNERGIKIVHCQLGCFA